MKNRYLTGVTTTGTPHLGNYVGAIRPAIESSKLETEDQSFFFLADYHAIIKCHEPEKVQQSTLEVAATWLALGLDVDKVAFYRQSDVSETMELAWVLNCLTAKGLMNRGHAYKAAVQNNVAVKGNDPDRGITMGLFGYPVLMAADILMFNGSKIPVGKDQIQHVEMARDIAKRFNHLFCKKGQEIFVLPEAQVAEDAVLVGLDGRKMSKSYGNTIPLFETEKKLQKSINKIKTNLLAPGEKKDTSDSAVFEVWCAFANSDQKQYMQEEFNRGIAWGQAKKELYVLINEELKAPRERYVELMANPKEIEEYLLLGAQKAREEARPRLDAVKEAIGIRKIT